MGSVDSRWGLSFHKKPKRQGQLLLALKSERPVPASTISAGGLSRPIPGVAGAGDRFCSRKL
eukprot:210027-Prymnesium_polylepis.1